MLSWPRRASSAAGVNPSKWRDTSALCTYFAGSGKTWCVVGKLWARAGSRHRGYPGGQRTLELVGDGFPLAGAFSRAG